MASETSWAEGRWWRGTLRSYVWLLLILLLLPFALLSLVMRQRAAPPLQQFYTQAYRTGCAGVGRPLVLPYVQRADGGQTLASISEVNVLPPRAAGRPSFALTDTAIRSGVKQVQVLRTAEGSRAATCLRSTDRFS